MCVATGPSLTPEQVDYVHRARIDDRCRVIAVNEAGLRQYLPLSAPWADILYAADRKWWEHYIPEFYGMRVCGDHTMPKVANVHQLDVLQTEQPMPRVPGRVLSGGHSGFQALNMALGLGAQRVILVGYDCGGPERNCHKDRPAVMTRLGRPPFEYWVQQYNRVPKEFPNRRVILCAQHSRITAFEKSELEDVL